MSPEAARSWTHTHEESRLLRALAVLPPAVVGTGVLAVAISIVGVIVALFVGGNYVIGVTLLLAVAVMSARVAPHHLARVESDGSFVGRLRELGPRTVAAAVLASVAVWAVGVALGRAGYVAVVVGTVLVPLALRAVLSSEGSVEPEDGTLTYCGTDLDLASLDRVRRLGVGGYVVYRLSFVAGAATVGTPRWLVVPRHVDSHVRTALDAGVTADSGDHGPPNRAVQLVAGAFGLCLFGFAGFLLRIEPATGQQGSEGVLLYAALVATVFGVLFVVTGLRGG